MTKKTAEQVTEGIDASGLTIIVTGGTNGIGRETVRVLVKRGARVFLASRSMSAMEKVKADIIKETPGARLDLLKIDLSSMASVRTAAEEFLALNVPLNVLINNAGIFSEPPLKLSADGIELTFATNYIGPFLLTSLLLDKLTQTAKETGKAGRIVNVSSNLYKQFSDSNEGIRLDSLNDEKGYYFGFGSYSQSKLAQILYTKELAERLKDKGANVTVNALHPGAIKTNIGSTAPLWTKPFMFFLKLFFDSVDTGAATQIYLAVSPDVEGVTGKYFENLQETPLTGKHAFNDDLQKKLWDFSVKTISA